MNGYTPGIPGFEDCCFSDTAECKTMRRRSSLPGNGAFIRGGGVKSARKRRKGEFESTAFGVVGHIRVWPVPGCERVDLCSNFLWILRNTNSHCTLEVFLWDSRQNTGVEKRLFCRIGLLYMQGSCSILKLLRMQGILEKRGRTNGQRAAANRQTYLRCLPYGTNFL